MNSLEDFHEDILGKAMRGLGIGKNEMAQRFGLEKSEIEAILNGEVDEKLINAMAGELKLDSSKLMRSAKKEWSPLPVELIGLRQISSNYGEMIVSLCGLGRTYKFAWILIRELIPANLVFIEEANLKQRLFSYILIVTIFMLG